MAEIGYALSSEEHGPRDLVGFARRAEQAGFGFALVSDHFHPWIDRQGNSPFVWSVIGGISEATERLRVGTGVTCPLIRTHPAIIAQAAATAACMLPRRFFLGVGTGENLNEHVHGDRWPPADVRLEMLEEAIAVMRLLWQGGEQDHRGRYYTVENARLYTLPEDPTPLMVAAKGPKAAEVAGRLGDGLIGTAPDEEMLRAFDQAGGRGKARYGKVTVCWAKTEQEARRTAREWWPNSALKGEIGVELPLPRHFEQATETLKEEDVADSIVCGPDPDRHLEAIRSFADGGYDHVYVHQVGADQEGFFRFYEEAILPKLS
jgi:coenzyme F420-dependent glucose-6-phosphate dehydrogenase